MNLPTNIECLKMLDEQKATGGLKMHMFVVAKVCRFLAESIKSRGFEVNVELVHKAALLHDLDKLQCLGENCKEHGKIAAKIIIEKGYAPELAELVRMHCIEPDCAEGSWELRILRYADARALRGDIVSMKERIAYTQNTYPFINTDAWMEGLKKLEKDICGKAGIAPEQLAGMIDG